MYVTCIALQPAETFSRRSCSRQAGNISRRKFW